MTQRAPPPGTNDPERSSEGSGTEQAQPRNKPAAVDETKAAIEEIRKLETAEELTVVDKKEKSVTVANKKDLVRLLNEHKTRLAQGLADLETLTWKAEEPQVLNLQIVLRRRYEAAISAAAEDRQIAASVSGRASTILVAAVVVAILGWLAAVTGVLLGKDIEHMWPALVATSAAVLLLVGIATLAFRFAHVRRGRTDRRLKET